MFKLLFSVCLLRNVVVLAEMTRFLILHSPIIPGAGRFSLMRKANWRRRNYQTPWRRLLRNTTVSYRQIPARAKRDWPGKPQPNTKHCLQQHQVRNTAGILISGALICIYKTTLQLVTAYSDCAPFLVSFMQCLLWHPRIILGHKRFILFFYYYSI